MAYPPHYSALAAAAVPVLLEISPLADSITFVTGLLGRTAAALEGHVQVKYTGVGAAEEAATRTGRPRFDKLEVGLRGVEWRDGEPETVICSSIIEIWSLDVPSTSAAASNGTPDSPPSTIRFSIPLPTDLPSCLHLPGSALEYNLCATFSSTSPSLTAVTHSVPIHLSRSGPEDLGDSAPLVLALDNPLPVTVKLDRSVYRRRDAISLTVKLAVPRDVLGQRGLRLRTIKAELRRVVVVGDASAISKPQGVVQGRDEIGEVVAPVLPLSTPQYSIIASSGKSCRFSASRPIVIKLRLYPPLVAPCGGSTQSTRLHNISFEVRVCIGLFQASVPVPCELVQQVIIIPDLPALVKSEKQKEVESARLEAVVPPYFEAARSGAASTSNTPVWPVDRVDEARQYEYGSQSRVGSESEDEPEFDGYEELSEALSTRIPPPTINEDVSPPSHLLSSSTSLPINDVEYPSLEASLDDLTTEIPRDTFQPLRPPHHSSPSGILLSQSLSSLLLAAPSTLEFLAPSQSTVHDPSAAAQSLHAPSPAESDRSGVGSGGGEEPLPPPYMGDTTTITVASGVNTTVSTLGPLTGGAVSGPPPYES